MQPPVMFALTSSQEVTITNILSIHTTQSRRLVQTSRRVVAAEQMIRATSRAIMIRAVGFTPPSHQPPLTAPHDQHTQSGRQEFVCQTVVNLLHYVEHQVLFLIYSIYIYFFFFMCFYFLFSDETLLLG